MDRAEAAQLLAKRRRDLEQIRDSARQQLGSPPEDQELATYDQHPADLATDTVEREQHLSVVEMAETSLRDVERAEERLEQGKYGICEACGKPIPDERLRALPETPYDVEHAAGAVA
jgi:RNA polymerase-binding transcription factor DksA